MLPKHNPCGGASQSSGLEPGTSPGLTPVTKLPQNIRVGIKRWISERAAGRRGRAGWEEEQG